MADARLTRLIDHLRPGRLTDAEQELVVRLRTLPPGPEPDPRFQARLRDRLLDMAPDLLDSSEVPAGAEATDAGPASADLPAPANRPKPSKAVDIADRRRTRSVRRPLTVVAAAAAVLVVLLGVTVWLSGNALPGDALYGLKRASEDVQLATTQGDEAKGTKHLDFAATRVSEVRKLIGQSGAVAAAGPTGVSAAGGPSAKVTALIVKTLAAADTQAADGARLLGTAAVSAVDKSDLAPIQTWAVKQGAALDAIVKRLPSGNGRAAALSSRSLVSQISTRAAGLAKSMGCACLTTAKADKLGPLPCGTCPAPQTGPGGTSTSSTPAPGGTRSSVPTKGRSSSSSSSKGNGGGGGQTKPNGPTLPGPTLPTGGGGGGGGGGGKTSSTCIVVVCLPSVPSTPICLPVVCPGNGVAGIKP